MEKFKSFLLIVAGIVASWGLMIGFLYFVIHGCPEWMSLRNEEEGGAMPMWAALFFPAWILFLSVLNAFGTEEE